MLEGLALRRAKHMSIQIGGCHAQRRLDMRSGRNRTTSGASSTANGIFSSVASRPRTGTWSQQGDADYLG